MERRQATAGLAIGWQKNNNQLQLNISGSSGRHTESAFSYYLHFVPSSCLGSGLALCIIVRATLTELR
jgi:hypothetical protein